MLIGVAGLQPLGDAVEAVMLVAAGHRQHVGEIEHARRIVLAHADDDLQRRQSLRLELARRRLGDLRRQRLRSCRDSRRS